MFIEKQSKQSQNDYLELLRIMGSLSNLFSDKSVPYLPYRVTENLFCMCLDAKNLSRSDCTADASKDGIGIGIKTFVDTANNTSMQKIAEFNRRRSEYSDLKNEELIKAVSVFRNERINYTKRLHSLNDIIYHYTVRNINKISVLECPLEIIDIENIKLDKNKNDGVIYFNDNINEYCFNISKSTLYKRFDTSSAICEIPVNIIDNPYKLLRELLSEKKDKIVFSPIKNEPHVFLPLYSTRTGEVAPKSGLNQWNAAGRPRHCDEVYIPVPASVREKSPNFFPPRNKKFMLELPDGKELSAKICQDDGKALMSDPNEDLGHWLLRDVFNLREGEVLTLAHLQRMGIDSAVVYRQSSLHYSIDFTTMGSYDEFIGEEEN